MYELSMGSLNIKAFDLAGQLAKRSLWEQFFPLLNGIIFMVDASDPLRIEEAKVELDVCPSGPPKFHPSDYLNLSPLGIPSRTS